ncbi:MAG: thioredoxin domain-containing protein [Gemmatimonadota bacterium]|nr:thioredoxin domain-containing protein [Gemmatimonadota bacterium]
MSRLEAAISLVLTLAIAAMATVFVKREFFPNEPPPPPLPTPEFVETWRELLPHGTTIGNPEAVVKIIVFSDLQCPNCRRGHEVIRRVQLANSADVAIVFPHFPLTTIHQFAMPAAIAAECATAGGALEQFLDLAYAQQDSLGIKPWELMATEASVESSAAFSACLADSTTRASVAADIAKGKEFEVDATPTLFINGWKYRGTPPEAVLMELVTRLVKEAVAAPVGINPGAR